ncbi:hypothetical protein [Namhaeicola litoreus]|uniref:Lipoprotein n=1 Tax=Namhaeicola litoreus TaxID=1052145 RepID=A0ABW3XWR5_9FLAO
MKVKFILTTLILFILNGCIVKSLHPFYTENTIFFDNRFLGTWEDDKSNKCEVYSFQKKFLEINKKRSSSDLTTTEIEEFNKYKDAYYIVLTEGSKKATFSVFSFKIEDQVFLDFTPMYIDLGKINNLASQHLMGMHTLVKLEFTNDNSVVNLKFFEEEKLKELIDQNRIKIKHEKIGHNENNYLLTASSRELQRFITKYMNSPDQEKWAMGQPNNYNFKLKLK